MSQTGVGSGDKKPRGDTYGQRFQRGPMLPKQEPWHGLYMLVAESPPDPVWHQGKPGRWAEGPHLHTGHHLQEQSISEAGWQGGILHCWLPTVAISVGWGRMHSAQVTVNRVGVGGIFPSLEPNLGSSVSDPPSNFQLRKKSSHLQMSNNGKGTGIRCTPS